MSNFEDAVIQRIKQLEREVERLQKWERPIVITDHGTLSGLSDDDHPKYTLAISSSVDNEVPRFDGTDGRKFQSSGMKVDDSGNVSTAAGNQPACPTTTTDTGIIVADGTDGKKVKSTSAKIDSSGNIELPSSASLKLKSYNVGEWASWTPTVTGWASGYTCIARRSVVSKICFWEVYISGTSNSTTTKITAPFTSADIDASFNWSGACATIVDAGTTSTTGGRWAIGNNSNEIIFLKDFANTAFTASGTKTIRAQGFYEMA